MRIYNYNQEKKDPIPTDLYFKFGLGGLVLGVIVISLGISLKFLFGLVFKYWLWVIGIFVVAFSLKKIFLRGKKK